MQNPPETPLKRLLFLPHPHPLFLWRTPADGCVQEACEACPASRFRCVQEVCAKAAYARKRERSVSEVPVAKLVLSVSEAYQKHC